MADRYRDRWGNEYTGRRGDYQQDYGRRDFENYPEDFDRDYDRGTFDRGRDYDYGRGEFGRGYGRDWDYERRGSYGRGGYGSQGYQGGFGQSGYGRSFQSGGYGQADYGRGYQGGGHGPNDYGRGYQRGYGQGSQSGGYGQGYQGYYGSQQGRGSYDRGFSGSGPNYGSDWEESDFDTGPTSWSYTEIWLIPGPFTGRGPRSYQRSDDKIQDDINDRLTQHGQLDASDVNVQVKNGEVTITGMVNSRKDKRMAEDVAESVSGVRDVHNQLRVKQQNQGTGQMTHQTGQQSSGQTGQESAGQTSQQNRMGQQATPQTPQTQGQQNR